MNLSPAGFCESLEATEMTWIVNLHHRSRWACLAEQERFTPLPFRCRRMEWKGVWGMGTTWALTTVELLLWEGHQRETSGSMKQISEWKQFLILLSCAKLREWILGIQVNQTKNNHSEVVQVKQRWNQEREDHYYIFFSDVLLILVVKGKPQTPSCICYLHCLWTQVETKVRKIESELLMIPFKKCTNDDAPKHCIFNEIKFSYCQNVIINAHITKRYKI